MNGLVKLQPLWEEHGCRRSAGSRESSRLADPSARVRLARICRVLRAHARARVSMCGRAPASSVNPSSSPLFLTGGGCVRLAWRPDIGSAAVLTARLRTAARGAERRCVPQGENACQTMAML
jgi:hypothetical protein